MAVVEAQLSRRERRRLEVRDRIVETSVALFETRGFEATTVEEIAKQADIAYGTFFNHFPSKLDLLREISDLTMRELFDNVEEIRRRPGTFGQHLVMLFESAAETAQEKGPQAREMLSAMMSQAFPQSAISDDRRMRVVFRSFLEDGLAAGEVRKDVDIDTLTEVFVGSWYSMFLSWVHFDGYPLRQRAAATARFLSSIFTTPEGER